MPLHPFIEALLKQLAGRPAFSDGSPDDARALVAAGRAAIGPGPAMLAVRDLAVPGRAGGVPVRLFMPTESPSGVIVYLHGGGWVVGALDDFDTLARTLAVESGCAVVLVDYRLAPEHPFPAGLEDGEDVLRWVARQGEATFGARLPIVVAGDSAGANLAAVAARRLRGEVEIVLQGLVYPVADSDFTTASYERHGEGLTLTRADMAWFFRHYAPPALWSSPDISPLRAPDLSGLPPALVVVAEYDVLADEGAAYAARLREAGVVVTERHVAGATHGFIRLHTLFDVARAEVEALARAAAAACAADRTRSATGAE